MEDSRIIDLFFERSEQAVSELGRKYGKAVKALSLNILGDVRDAEECAADTYLAVWNSVPPKRPEHLKAYTLAIARNLSLDRYHGSRVQKRNGSYDLPFRSWRAAWRRPGMPRRSWRPGSWQKP